jgi:hypothetical protein
LLNRFTWGINVDNIWTYAGVPPPKSVIVPYVLSMRMPRGPVEILEHPNAKDALVEHILLPQEAEPETVVEEVCGDFVARLKSARISLVRTWFPWNFFGRNSEGEVRFPLDTFVRTLTSNGIEILGVLGNGYTRFLPTGAAVDHLEKYIESVIPLSEEIVRHYRDLIKVWQIENEPNWWKEHLAVYWRTGLIWLESKNEELILGPLYDVVRRECPGGTIMINLESDRQKVDHARYSKYCDVLGLDLYPGYAHPHKTSAEEIAIAKQVKLETGKQVIISETGHPSGPGLLGYNEARQAEYIGSACQNAYACDAINALCPWNYSDSYWRSFPMQENHFGLLTKERKPKAAWFEYENQIKDLAGK